MPAGLNRAAILLVPLIAACGSSQPASDPTASPASKAASQPASPPATQPAAETRPSSDLVGVVWTSADPSAALGSFRIFLPDGTLVVDSCFETYRLSPWRQIGERRIEWAEDTARIEADIVELTPERLRLKLQLKSEVKEEAYRRTRAPFVCPDMPRGDPTSDTSSSVMRVEGTVTYSERLVLRPSAVVTVELRDTARADAPARTLATQRIPASQGPPFKFAFSVPAEKIDPKAALAVFATIREGVRLMFITDTRNAVPREGATDMDVQLMFVASAPGDRAPGIVTPVPAAYRCGSETFGLAFEEGVAYVTLPDNSLMKLDRLKAPTLRTRGGRSPTAVSLVQEGDRVLFARGRMVPAPCTRVNK